MSFLASPAPPSASAGAAPSAPRSHAGAASTYEPPAPYVISSPAGRLLCVADVRGNLAHLNDLAARHNAHAILHTGDFGFYEAESIARVADRTLRHLVQYSTLLSPAQRSTLLSDGARPAGSAAGAPSATLRSGVSISMLSTLPQLLSGALTLAVPVYAVWGACEDVCVLERFRTGEYAVPNLHILDEATSHVIEVGGVRLRLFGLGGAVVLHKLFDNGEGNATIAGAGGTMWTTMLQIGELIDTAQKCWDPSETRMLITHASPGREGLLSQLALQLKADLTLSASLHFRYGVSYNEFSVQSSASQLRTKLTEARAAFQEVWEAVSTQVEAVIDERQRVLLNHALAVTRRIPPAATPNGAVAEEPAAKTMWNWNLPDAAYGALLLEVEGGRVGATMHSQGFTFAHRREAAAAPTAPKQGISPSNSANLKPASQPHTPAGPKAAQQQPAQQAPPRSAGGASNKSFNGDAQARRGGANGSAAHSNASVPASPAKSRRTKSTASTASALSSAPSGAPSNASRAAEEKSGDDDAAAATGTGATPEGTKRKTTRGGKKNRSKKEGAAAAAAASGNESAPGQGQQKNASAAPAPAATKAPAAPAASKAPAAPAATQGAAESK